MHVRWSGAARAQKRLAAAGFLSVLVHALLSAILTAGGASHRIATLHARPPSSLSARLLASAPEAMRAPAPRERSRPEQPKIAARHERSEATATGSAERAQADAGPIELPDATYYAARQLDVYPMLVTPLALRYPPEAPAHDANGRVLLMVHIDAQGAVDTVSVVEAEPAGYFEDDARRAFESAQFRPALRNGRPVKSRILVQVDYGAAERTSR